MIELGSSRTILKLAIIIVTILYVEATYLISASDNKTTNQSESVILSCKAYNNLTAQLFTVAWRRAGVVITERKLVNRDNLRQFIDEDEQHRYSIQGLPATTGVTDYRLEIKDLKKEDIDDYACSLCTRPVSSYACIHPLDITENLPVSLDVMYTPEQPVCSILEKTSIGADITVVCVSGQGKPRVDLKFTVDGHFIDGETPSPSEDGLLRITHSFVVTESNIGKEIGCNSTSPHFKDYIGSCKHGTIIVHDLPELSLTSSLYGYVSIGEPVSFICSAKSRSDIKYFDWTTDPKSAKDRMVVVTDLTGSTSTMMLPEAYSDDDQTRINCAVANDAGEVATVAFVLVIADNLIPSTAVHLETTSIAGNKTSEELESVAESNVGQIAGIILTFVALIVISGIAGYLLFVRRRKTYKRHDPVSLDETSSPIKPDKSWSEKEYIDQTEKFKLETDDNLNECDQNGHLPEGIQKEPLYDEVEEMNNLDEDDVFMDVTEVLPIPTHV